MLRSDDGSQEPVVPADDHNYPDGANYFVEDADDKEYLGGSQAGGLCLFDPCIPVCASLLKANLFNLCLYSDNVASADSSMTDHLYSSLRGPWLVL